MASLTKDPKGRWVLFTRDAQGLRRTIRLGMLPESIARDFRDRVTQLELHKYYEQALDRRTVAWLRSIPEQRHRRLFEIGLTAPRDAGDVGSGAKPEDRAGSKRLGAFLQEYIEERDDVKKATLAAYGNVRRNLIKHFGADRELMTITAGDADDFRRFLARENLAQNTIRRRCGAAKQLFRRAVRKAWIQTNPFQDMKGVTVTGSDPKRRRFITTAEAAAVLDACPDAEWRLLFALSRFGGLRCPSEHLALQWTDVDWARKRLTVRSPKTEHHVGGESRVVPLFPELEPHLSECWNQAQEGAVHVITRYRDPAQNLRTQLGRIIRRAGLTPWPKLWHNLRASRETELARTYPIHVVTKWIGNSAQIAQRHYLQVTEQDFERAVQVERASPAHQQGRADECKEVQCTSLHNHARGCSGKVGVTGLEPVTSCV